MRATKILILAVLVGVLAMPSAFAARFSVFGGVNKAIGNVSGSANGASFTVTPKMGYQGGLGIEFPLGKVVGFELNALYVAMKADSSATVGEYSTSTAVSVEGLQFPGMLRFHFGRVISLAGGAFYDYALEDNVENDYGALGSLRFSIPLGKSAAFLLDGRYLYGLKDYNGSKSKSWQALAGVTFGGRKK